MSNLNVNNITPINGSSGTIGVSGSLFVSGNVTGSFSGDGSGLTNVSSLITEWDGTRNGDASITGSLVLSGSDIALNVIGDITASGNIVPGGKTHSLGSESNPWKELFVSSNSLVFISSSISASVSASSTASFGVILDDDGDLALEGISYLGKFSGSFKGNGNLINTLQPNQITVTGSNAFSILSGNTTMGGDPSAAQPGEGATTIKGNTLSVTATTSTVNSTNTTINSNTVISGSLIVTGSLTITGSNTLTNIGPFNQTGNITSIGTIFQTGATSITGSLTVSGSDPVTLKNLSGGGTKFVTIDNNGVLKNSDGLNVSISGSTIITGSLTTSGSTTTTGSVNISGSTIIDGSTDITGSVTISGSLIISGSGTLENIGPFNQTGTSTFTGEITASGNISSSGTIIGSNLSGTNTGDITLTGTPDYITLSNQVITRNQIDLANDVTGVLPSANLDADTAHLTTDQTFSGNKTFSAAITASGNISSSGTVTAAAAVLTTADINGGTVDGITSLTATGDLDIGAHELRAETFQSDIATGTAPFTVASTTAVTNLQSATATTLHTARNINGVSFNGSANITVTAAGSTLSDTVTVAKGGTGATSFADKSVIITQDSGTDTLAAVAMSTNGQLLIGGTNGPAVAVPTGGDGLTVTVGDGTLEYDLDASLTTVTSVLAEDLVLGEDAQTKIDFETANEIHFDADNAEVANIKAGGVNITGHITASGNISSSGQVYDGTYHQWEVSVQADTDDDTNWQGPPTTGLIGATTWAKDFGTEYDGTSNIVQTRTNINTGWRIPHGANYSASIKSIDVYVGGATNATIDASDHLSASLWYSTAADVDERLNQSGTTGITQRHGGTAITTQVGETLVKFNNYLISQSINVDLAPGAMLWPRVKMADGSSQNLLWNIYYIVHYCKKPL